MINLGVIDIGWPEAIMLVMLLANFIKVIVHLGELKKKDRYDWVDLWVAPVIWLGLLYWGGFFS